MSAVNRRTFLRGAVGAGALAALSPWQLLEVQRAFAAAPAEPRGVHLSFTGDPYTTATVMWFTDGTADVTTTVQYAVLAAGVETAPDPLPLAATGTSQLVPYPAVGLECRAHEVTMTGLTPGGTVAYRVGSAGSWSPVRFFATLPPSGAPMRILAFGDHGTGPQAHRTVTRSIAEAPDITLIAGDISYDNSAGDKWDPYFDLLEPLAATVPVLTALGNHDSEDETTTFNGTEAQATYSARFAQPGTQPHYSIDLGRVHLLVLEAGEAVIPGQLADELAFAESDLAAATARRAAGEIDFVVVMQHFPLYNNDDGRSPADYTLVAAQEPLFQQYQIDVLLVGHNHHYERSKPMVYGEATTEELDRYGPDRVGYVTVITGGGGAGLYDFIPEPAAWAARSIRRHHVTVLDYADHELRIRALGTDDQLPDVLDDFVLERRAEIAPAAVVPEIGAPVLIPLAAVGLVTLAYGRHLHHAAKEC